MTAQERLVLVILFAFGLVLAVFTVLGAEKGIVSARYDRLTWDQGWSLVVLRVIVGILLMVGSSWLLVRDAKSRRQGPSDRYKRW